MISPRFLLRRRLLSRALLPLVGCVLLGPSASHSQAITWTGAVGNSWGSPGNWTSTPPFDGTDQLLLSTLQQPSQSLGANRSIHSLTINQGGFIVSGNSLSFYGDGAGIFSTGNNTVNSNFYPFVATSLRSNSGTLTLGGVINTNGGTPPAAKSPVFEGAGNITVSGSIQGGGGLSMNGTGTLLLTGTNFFNGAMTVNSGTLKFASTASNTANPSLLLYGGTFDLNGLDATVSYLNGGGSVVLGAKNLTMTASGDFASPSYSGTISGNGGVVLQISATGVQTLSGISTYKGGTVVKSGLVSFNADANFGDLSGALTLDGGGLMFPKTATVGRAITVGAGGALFSAGIGATCTFTAINGNGPVTYGYSSFSSGQNVWLPQANLTYTGTTNLATGSLILTDNSQLGAAGNAVVAGGGSLLLRGGLTIAGRTITVGYGGGDPNDIGGLVSDTGNNTWSGPVIASFSAQVGTAAGSTLTLAGPISSASNNSLSLYCNGDTFLSGNVTGTPIAKGGTGTLTVSGNNVSGGNLTVTSGTAILQGGNAVADTAALAISQGATVRLAASEFIGSLSDYGWSGATFDLGQYDLSLGSGTYSGTITGAGRVFMKGTGTLNLSGNNTFTGGLYIDSGTLVATSDAAFGAPTNPVVFRGGALKIYADSFPSTSHPLTFTTADVSLNVASGTFSLGQTLTNAGSLTKVGAGTLVLTGPNSYGGATVLAEGTLSVSSDSSLGGGALSLQGGALQVTGNTFHSTTRPVTTGTGYTGFEVVDPANTFTLGAVTGAAGGIRKLGAGTLVLAGQTTLGDVFTVAGTLRLGISNALTATSSLNVSSGAVLDLAGFNQTAAYVSASGLLSTGAGTLSVSSGINAYSPGGTISGQVNLTGSNVNVYSSPSTSIPGGLTLSAAISGTATFTKTGAGSVILAGDNPFAGATAVNVGTLTLTGSLLHTVGLTIAQGALLEVAGGQLGVVGNATNNGFIRLTGSGTLAATGTITNYGVVDISQWNGTLPANLVNGKGGLFLDAAGLRITQISRSPTAMQITVNGLVGLSYLLQRTTSLTSPNWQIAGTSSVPQPATVDGPFVLTDNFPVTGSQAFYRVVLSQSNGSSGH